MLPQTLDRTVRPTAGAVQVRAAQGRAAQGPVRLDALLVRPVVSRMRVSGPAGTTELVHSTSTRATDVRVGRSGQRAQVRAYDRRGRLVDERSISGATTVTLRPGGLAIIATS